MAAMVMTSEMVKNLFITSEFSSSYSSGFSESASLKEISFTIFLNGEIEKRFQIVIIAT
jgi:hypothetical protein